MVSTEMFWIIIAVIILILLGPPLLFWLIANRYKKRGSDQAKIYFILAGIYLLIAGGICGGLYLS